MKIAPERLDNVIRLGYTLEEARFLYIVATHSGYFTHRQFLAFSETKPGKHSQQFLTRLLRTKHGTFHTHPSGGRVYHVFSRKIYNAIGRDDLRTRRKHQLEYVKTRILTLDFVLANLDYDYLETEAEKVPFFLVHRNLNRDLLPSKSYTSRRSAQVTKRYFVDRFPIFFRDGSLVPTFTYMEAGAATAQGFATHLEAYGGLLRSLPEYEFIYVAPSERFFASAREEFARRVLGLASSPSKEELLRYFRLRKSWEQGERVAAADVVFLNEAARDFGKEGIERQYREWVQGTLSEGTVSLPSEIEIPCRQAKVSTHKCGASLCVFERSAAQRGESPADIASGEFSPVVSPEVSRL